MDYDSIKSLLDDARCTGNCIPPGLQSAALIELAFRNGSFATSWYHTDVSFERDPIVSDKPVRLMSLYAFNKSASQVYLRVVDDPGGDNAGLSYTPYPVPATGFVSLTFPGGKRFETGISLLVYTDAALTTLLGTDEMWYDVGMAAYE